MFWEPIWMMIMVKIFSALHLKWILYAFEEIVPNYNSGGNKSNKTSLTFKTGNKFLVCILENELIYANLSDSLQIICSSFISFINFKSYQTTNQLSICKLICFCYLWLSIRYYSKSFHLAPSFCHSHNTFQMAPRLKVKKKTKEVPF